jgi:hypothetical protein
MIQKYHTKGAEEQYKEIRTTKKRTLKKQKRRFMKNKQNKLKTSVHKRRIEDCIG